MILRTIFGALVAIVTFGFITPEAYSFWGLSLHQYTKMRVADRSIGERVFVLSVSPYKYVAIPRNRLLKVFDRYTDAPAADFPSGTKSYTGVLGNFGIGNRKIRLQSTAIPFGRNPLFQAIGGSCSIILPSNANIGTLNNIGLPFFLLDGGNLNELTDANICPQLNTRLIFEGFVSSVKEICTDDSRDRQNNGRATQNDSPSRYGSIVAFSFGPVAAARGIAGLWIGLHRHSSGLLYLLSRIIARMLAWISAALWGQLNLFQCYPI